jgi:hypothetical protein
MPEAAASIGPALGRDVPVLPAGDGTLPADDNGKSEPPRRARSYISRALGTRPSEARQAMEALAASLPVQELHRVGFRLYERSRPDLPAGAERWVGRDRVLRRHAWYLGEINDSQEIAWRKSTEVFQEGTVQPRSPSLFPDDRCNADEPLGDDR